jgi:hypothetical protein
MFVAGLTALPIKRALDHYRAKNHLQRLVGKMQQLHSLAINYQMAMKLMFYKKGNKICYRFDSEEPLKFISRSEVFLEGVADFSFNEKAMLSELIFGRDGSITPEGILSFHLKEKEAYFIDLQNNPNIKLLTSPPQKKPNHFLAREDIE